MIEHNKTKDEKYKKTRADLQLAREREKELMENIGSKDEEIVELRQSVEHWKKKAQSGSQEREKQVEQQSHIHRECYVSVQNVKAGSPPCRQPGEASSLVSPPGGGDTGSWEEEEVAGGELEEEQEGVGVELEEEQGEQGGVSSEEEGAGMEGGNNCNGSVYKQGRGGLRCNVCRKSFR